MFFSKSFKYYSKIFDFFYSRSIGKGILIKNIDIHFHINLYKIKTRKFYLFSEKKINLFTFFFNRIFSLYVLIKDHKFYSRKKINHNLYIIFFYLKK